MSSLWLETWRHVIPSCSTWTLLPPKKVSERPWSRPSQSAPADPFAFYRGLTPLASEHKRPVLPVSGDRLLRSSCQTKWFSYYWRPGLCQPHRQMARREAELLRRLLLHTGMTQGRCPRTVVPQMWDNFIMENMFIGDNWASIVVGHGGGSSSSGPLLRSGVQSRGCQHGDGPGSQWSAGIWREPEQQTALPGGEAAGPGRNCHPGSKGLNVCFNTGNGPQKDPELVQVDPRMKWKHSHAAQ